ncbi:MAG: hypothetical protein DCC68_22885 [Planctomycetota bacterium]|nr:MAG: hypothetical protein DCC68_22885 [Planctomycetota bacterium]
MLRFLLALCVLAVVSAVPLLVWPQWPARNVFGIALGQLVFFAVLTNGLVRREFQTNLFGRWEPITRVDQPIKYWSCTGFFALLWLGFNLLLIFG